MLAEELPRPNCPPVRVQLLGERLIAFRDTQGRIGLMDEFCAHRGVSLWFGRNEENGLRCCYHGWKYDVTGQCIDVPSEPASSGFAQKIKLKAYPTIELGGVIWAYMGPPAEQPPAPNFEWVHLPSSHVYISKRWQECNYLQAMEGGIDSSHVSFLHRYDLDRDPLHRNTDGAKHTRNTNTVFDILELPGGLLIGARRNADPGYHYWRVTQWLMPWYTLIPPYKGNALNGHAWVPMDDTNNMAWTMTFHPVRPLTDEELDTMRKRRRRACRAHPRHVPAGRQPPQQLPDGPRGAGGRPHLQRHQGPRHAGRLGAGKHGPDPGPQQGEPGLDRQRDHHGAAAAAQGRAGGRRRARRAPGLEQEAQSVRSASFILPEDGAFAETALDAAKVRQGQPHVAV